MNDASHLDPTAGSLESGSSTPTSNSEAELPAPPTAPPPLSYPVADWPQSGPPVWTTIPADTLPPPPSGPPVKRSRLLTVVAALVLLALGLTIGLVASRSVASNPSSTNNAAVPSLSVNTAALPAAGSGTPATVAAALEPSVVTIVASGGGGVGLGSGFVVSSANGTSYLLTNNHVVSGAVTLKVILGTGSTLTGTVVGADSIDDLAVVSVPVGGLTAVTFGDSSTLAVGQSVVAIGSPLGNQNSVTTGVVSALHRTITAGDTTGTASSETLGDVLQTDASINPGNSGGPLADLGARVIGVNVATSSNGTNISFSIPSNQARTVAERLIAHQTVEHPFLGIGYMTALDAAENGQPFAGPGVLITAVQAGSPAATAGLQVGDTIVAVDGTAIGSALSTVGGLISQHHVGETVKLTVLRNGQNVTLSATLVEHAAVQ